MPVEIANTIPNPGRVADQAVITIANVGSIWVKAVKVCNMATRIRRVWITGARATVTTIPTTRVRVVLVAMTVTDAVSKVSVVVDVALVVVVVGVFADVLVVTASILSSDAGAGAAIPTVPSTCSRVCHNVVITISISEVTWVRVGAFSNSLRGKVRSCRGHTLR